MVSSNECGGYRLDKNSNAQQIKMSTAANRFSPVHLRRVFMALRLVRNLIRSDKVKRIATTILYRP